MWKRTTTILVALGISSALVGCGPPPKPAELAQLETMRNDEFTAQLTQGAPGMLEKADKFYKMATKAWQEGELERAKEYAWLGQLRYRTAEAQTRTITAKKRFESAVEELRTRLQEGKVVEAQIEGVKKSIAALDQTLTAYLSQAAQTEKADAEAVLLTVEAEREKARGVNAEEFAQGAFNKGEQALSLAKTQLAEGRYKEAVKEANDARAAFVEAFATAKVEFDKTNAAQERAGREKALYDAAMKAFSPDAFKDGRGVVVVMPRLFERNKTTPDNSRVFQLNAAAEIAKNFPETTVMIEGYTQSKGSESKNLTISQSRAEAVRDHLLRNGVDARRITTTGYGEEKARYDNKDRDERGKNDRVEIVFVFTGS